MPAWTIRSAQMRGRAARALLAAAAMLAAGPAAAQSTQSFNDWTVVCEASGSCAMSQVITDGRGRRLLSMKIALVNTGPYLETKTPLGHFLPKGVNVRIDDGVERALTQVDCMRDGCRSVTSVDAPLLQAMKDGGKANVIFFDSASGKRLTVGASLRGFTAAFTALTQ